MKIFIIGNSHTACLKKAWDSLQRQYPGIEITFFAHRGKRILDLEVQGTRLIAPDRNLKEALSFTSGGYDHVDLTVPDVILIHGLSFRIHDNNHAFYSKAARRQASVDQAARSASFSFLKTIRSVNEIPVFIGHNPHHATDEGRSGAKDEYLAVIEWMNNTVFEPMGACLLAQPDSTLNGGFMTRKEFSVGSERLAIGRADDEERHAEDDVNHMNAAFGELFLREFLARIVEYDRASAIK